MYTVSTMKSSKSKSTRSRVKIVLMVILVLTVIGGLGYFNYRNLTRNYANEDARPLENAMTANGAKKLCSREDTGRGWDNRRPWYYAIFEVPGGREAATELALNTMKERGFVNFVGSAAPATPNDITTFSDKVSQRSSHIDLEEGPESVSLEIFYDSFYPTTGNLFCGVQETDNPPADKTLVRFTLSLPEYK